jgi:hypothetical protein
MAASPVAKLTANQWALVRKVVSYYIKHKMMINEYRNAKERAIANYKKVGFIEARSKKYEKMWEVMPTNYESKINAIDDRLTKWVISYCQKMFGVTLTPEEVITIVNTIKSGVTPLT